MMDTRSEFNSRILVLLKWIARAASLLSITTIVLFFVGEGFDPARVEWRQWIGLLFFPAAVVAGMIIAWWREWIGGTITIAGLAAFYLIYGLAMSGKWPGGAAFLVFSLPGFVFLLHAWLERRAGSEVVR